MMGILGFIHITKSIKCWWKKWLLAYGGLLWDILRSFFPCGRYHHHHYYDVWMGIFHFSIKVEWVNASLLIKGGNFVWSRFMSIILTPCILIWRYKWCNGIHKFLPIFYCFPFLHLLFTKLEHFICDALVFLAISQDVFRTMSWF